MPLTHLEILSRAPYQDRHAFGSVGPYERIDAIAHYAVDPLHRSNTPITDLALAPRDDDGRVRFSG